ncbi:MAG TPA: c-type cytochrome [Caulobacteraceae bacterium]|jgi:cytochrome c2|nr:c-type cytochrome [Caulobacteraceae bacterium]
MLIRASLVLALGLAVTACERARVGADQYVPGGDPERGRALIAAIGCGECHDIPGVQGAHGAVGPPLGNIGRRTIVAGLLPNTPANLEHWLEAPQSVVPGNAMPDMGINQKEARDVAAYLYTLR